MFQDAAGFPAGAVAVFAGELEGLNLKSMERLKRRR
jgi:hypothetical protein